MHCTEQRNILLDISSNFIELSKSINLGALTATYTTLETSNTDIAMIIRLDSVNLYIVNPHGTESILAYDVRCILNDEVILKYDRNQLCKLSYATSDDRVKFVESLLEIYKDDEKFCTSARDFLSKYRNKE